MSPFKQNERDMNEHVVTACNACVYWHASVEDEHGQPSREDSARGECRQKSPRRVEGVIGLWPETFSTSGCGDGHPYKTSKVIQENSD